MRTSEFCARAASNSVRSMDTMDRSAASPVDGASVESITVVMNWAANVR